MHKRMITSAIDSLSVTTVSNLSRSVEKLTAGSGDASLTHPSSLVSGRAKNPKGLSFRQLFLSS